MNQCSARFITCKCVSLLLRRENDVLVSKLGRVKRLGFLGEGEGEGKGGVRGEMKDGGVGGSEGLVTVI